MDREQVKEIFKMIVAVYPQFNVYPEKVDVWANLMKGQDFERVKSRVSRYAKENKFPPTVTNLTERIDETRNKNFTEKVEEWESEALGYCPYPTSDIKRVIKG